MESLRPAETLMAVSRTRHMSLLQSDTEKNDGVRYCGRIFTHEELEWIRALIASKPPRNRLQLSRAVCDQLGWLCHNGRLKEMSCRVAMLRMHRDDLITLPPPKGGNGNGRTRPHITSASDPGTPISLHAGQLGKLSCRPVHTRKDSNLWNQLIERYHYLGYNPMPGAQLRYFVESSHGLLAALGFGAAAWKIAPRDRFIGWSHEQRTRNLHFIVNNARFLILPWVTSRNLASRILSTITKQLPDDWHTRYGYQPVLMETFVQKNRFHGTCYRAANWILVGNTQGRGKLDRKNERLLPVKYIFLYPLNKNFRNILGADL